MGDDGAESVASSAIKRPPSPSRELDADMPKAMRSCLSGRWRYFSRAKAGIVGLRRAVSESESSAKRDRDGDGDGDGGADEPTVERAGPSFSAGATRFECEALGLLLLGDCSGEGTERLHRG